MQTGSTRPSASSFLDISHDVQRDAVALTPVVQVASVLRPPEAYGDYWDEALEPGEHHELTAYFRRFEHLREKFAFVNLRVGGKDNIVDLDGPKGCGITFEVPRHSLMIAVRGEIFDDLLIGNFMKTDVGTAGCARSIRISRPTSPNMGTTAEPSRARSCTTTSARIAAQPTCTAGSIR